MLPAQLQGRRVHLVREPEADAKAQAFLQNVLAGFTQAEYTMHFQSDEPMQGMELLDALRRGEIVAVQETVRGRAGGRSTRRCSEGRSRCRRVRPLSPGPRSANRRSHRGSDGDHAAGAAEIEWAIRRVPHQWFCFRRLWP